MPVSDGDIRTADIESINILSVSYAGVVQIGDTAHINARLAALAVQRELDHPVAGTVDFAGHRLFSFPLPVLPPAHDPPVTVNTVNECPRITVGKIRALAVSASSVMLAGNAGNVSSESRIKHFRQFAGPLSYLEAAAASSQSAES